jgi:hypothetical protein
LTSSEIGGGNTAAVWGFGGAGEACEALAGDVIGPARGALCQGRLGVFASGMGLGIMIVIGETPLFQGQPP